MSKRPTVPAKQISARPVAPRLGDELHEPKLSELLDDDQWTSSTIAHDLSGQQLRRRDVAECRFVGCRLTAADLHGSDLSGLRGIENVRGVTIDPDQVHDFTLALLAAHNVAVEPEREAVVPGS